MRVDRPNSGSLELPQVTQSGSLASRDGSAEQNLAFFAPPGSFTKLENSWSLLGLRPPAGGTAGRHRLAR
jgi:hypothetical protein